MRKVFTHCLWMILEDITLGKGVFIWPSNNKYKAKVFMGAYPDSYTKKKASNGRLTDVRLINNDYKLPRLSLNFSERSSRKDLGIYVSPRLYQNAIDVVNNGDRFSKFPRSIEDYLPRVYEKFSYIEENGLKKALTICFRECMWHLRRGENINFFLDKDQMYIRIYRVLGNKHKKVMTTNCKRRKSRIANGNGRVIKY
jgi:hypothetical protein